MKTWQPVRKLEVRRTWTDGREQQVGILAQNAQGVYFQYDADYLAHGASLSPFHLAWENRLQAAPEHPHHGLHGVFSDSLPDGWGNLLMDRVFRQHGIAPTQVTAMDRLAFVGTRAMGALSYQPASELADTGSDTLFPLANMGAQAQAVFDGQTQDVLGALVAAGSSGGARPKAQVYFVDDDFDHCRTRPRSGDRAWLVKFTSANLPLEHEEGRCEAAYLRLAGQAGLQVPNWQLLSVETNAWLALERFDRVPGKTDRMGRRHLHSACGLLDADFRSPSLDYEDLIRATSQLCHSPAAGQLQFRRALFNLFAANQDDHSKNWAFLQNDQGHWIPAPFYDVTFSPHPFGEHATSFAGFGKAPPRKAIQKLANQANFANWEQARHAMNEIVENIACFRNVAQAMGASQSTIGLVESQLNAVWQTNRHLLQPR